MVKSLKCPERKNLDKSSIEEKARYVQYLDINFNGWIFSSNQGYDPNRSR